MTENIQRSRKMMKGEADSESRIRYRGYVEYICPRCKVDLDPDDTECVACGHGGRPLRKEVDD